MISIKLYKRCRGLYIQLKHNIISFVQKEYYFKLIFVYFIDVLIIIIIKSILKKYNKQPLT